MRRLSALAWLVVPLLGVDAAQAQQARSEDVSSIDAIIEAYYDVISGPAGEPADVARDRSCLLYTSPSPRDVEESRMPSSA